MEGELAGLESRVAKGEDVKVKEGGREGGREVKQRERWSEGREREGKR